MYEKVRLYDAGMTGRSRAALVSLVLVAVIGVALGLGLAGLPEPAPASPGASASQNGTVSGSSPADSPTPSGATPPAASATATASGAVVTGQVVTWNRLSPVGVGPAARQGASWTVDPSTGVAYLYGGTTSASTTRPLAGGATLGDLWAYDLAADTWEPVVGTSDEPPPRSGHTAAWVDSVGLVVVGGRDADGKPLGDAWRFDPTTGAWSRIRTTGAQPPARFDACGAAPGDGTLWLSHGTNGPTQFGTTWRLDLASRRWTEIARNERPTARSRAVCWVDVGGRFVLYGGDRGGTALGDLWAMSVGDATAAWTRLAGGGAFPPRSGAAGTIHLDQTVIAGGLGQDHALRADIGTFDPAATAIRPVPADGPTPPARAGAVLVDDPAGERILLLGGVTADGPSAELWSADLR